MGSKKWCIGQAPLRDGPNGVRLFDIPPAAMVEATGRQQNSPINGSDVLWSEIEYRGRSGWVYDGYLEDYVDRFPPDEVLIQHPTPDPNDAAQYMIWEGRVKYNMCGELSAAWIGGDDIETFLKKWRKAAPGYYKWALFGDSDKPTGVDALESMLSVYGYPFPMLRAQTGLTDPFIGLRITPGRIQRMLQRHFLIAGVKIDRNNGRLRGEGVGHWVVVDKVTPQGINAGLVELYNSFPNQREEYSYDEFLNSV
ncbi:MAG: hypothetical protein ACM3QS_02700, partial [Bacteroidota bacterium]